MCDEEIIQHFTSSLTTALSNIQSIEENIEEEDEESDNKRIKLQDFLTLRMFLLQNKQGCSGVIKELCQFERISEEKTCN